jgi:hypothetical protein
MRPGVGDFEVATGVRDFCGISAARVCFVVPIATGTPQQVIEFIDLAFDLPHS